MTTLIIVESPGKIKTIQKYLGNGYTVAASYGHICDLPTRANPATGPDAQQPWANIGIEPGTFRALYVISPDKRQTVQKLRSLVNSADTVFLAMDADREGEGIAWHVARETGIKNPQRITFTEITPEALRAAIAAPRPLDMHLVDAQETRRKIDRYVGYGLGPLVWRAVQGKNASGQGLSAGRVQSAAQMLVAQRELSRMRFVPAAFWTIKATGTASGGPATEDALPFAAAVQLVRSKADPAGRPLATKADFESTGKLKAGRDVVTLDAGQAQALATHLMRSGAVVSHVERSEVSTRPPPPLITTSLQKAAGSVGMTASRIMDIAQNLYNAGRITYMRTDSPHLSDEAISGARQEAQRLFGAGAVPAQGRQYATRDKNAQEAHEAIRPAGSQIVAPEHSGLSGDELKVYALIYRRAVASQMQDARHAKTVLTLRAPAADLQARGRVVLAPGYTQLLKVRAREEDGGLPNVGVGAAITLSDAVAEQARTEPRERFTEGTLIDALKVAGIGRPSTYASTLKTLDSRGYTVSSGNALAISTLGILVTSYLASNVAQVVARDFTAHMEEGLDQIAAGTLSAQTYLQRFWSQELEPLIRQARKVAPQLALPHLPGAVLVSTPSGPQLEWDGQRTPISERAVPGDLREKDLNAIAGGTWKPKATGGSSRSAAETGTSAKTSKTGRTSAKAGAAGKGGKTGTKTGRTPARGAEQSTPKRRAAPSKRTAS